MIVCVDKKFLLIVLPLASVCPLSCRGDILDVGEDMQTLSVSKDLYFSRTQDFAVHKFTFDRVFPDSTRQRTFYRKCCKPLVMALCQGVNGCIITYGETKTGKTYTLEGPLLSEDPSDQGVIPLAVEDIFECVFVLRFLNDLSYCMFDCMFMYIRVCHV